jgi:hypothetical protein
MQNKKIKIGVMGAYRGTSMINYSKIAGNAELVAICDGIELTEDYVRGEGFSSVGFSNKFEDYHTFLHNSVFCQYAYIINLDERVVEFYVGDCNHNPCAKGRYAKFESGFDKVYGVKLLRKMPLSKFLKGKVTVDVDKENFVVS